MLPRNHSDRIRVSFDDHRLVANAGLLLPATLAQHLGLPELVQQCLDLGRAPGRANAGDKTMTLIASALAGGDCIDDADALRTGGTASTLGGTVKAPSTLGTFLSSSRWGHVRQMDRVSRDLLGRAWQAVAGPGDAPFTIDLDSTICETYGLDKEGARHHGYTGKRGNHPLLTVAAGTGDVLMCRLREGRANTARGVAIARLGDPGPGRYAPPHGALRNTTSTLVGRAYPGTTPREQRSLMACTSYRSSVLRCISAETLATPCVTVLWLRPPSSRPTCVNARPISCTSRYIATCLGTDMARLRLTLTRSSTPRRIYLPGSAPPGLAA